MFNVLAGDGQTAKNEPPAGDIENCTLGPTFAELEEMADVFNGDDGDGDEYDGCDDGDGDEYDEDAEYDEYNEFDDDEYDEDAFDYSAGFDSYGGAASEEDPDKEAATEDAFSAPFQPQPANSDDWWDDGMPPVPVIVTNFL